MHEIFYEYFDYTDTKAGFKKIAEECGDITEQRGEYHHRDGECVVFRTGMKPFASRKEAIQYLEDHYRAYEQIAVPYYATESLKKSAKYTKLDNQVNEAQNKFRKEDAKVCTKDFKSNLLGCKSCGSKLAVKFLKGNRCPVCGNDLRSKTQLDKIDRYKKNYIKLRDELKKLELVEAKKQTSKAKKKWLVKLEYHV